MWEKDGYFFLESELEQGMKNHPMTSCAAALFSAMTYTLEQKECGGVWGKQHNTACEVNGFRLWNLLFQAVAMD